MSSVLHKYINNLSEKFLILCEIDQTKKGTYLLAKSFCVCYLVTGCASCLVRRLYSINLETELFAVRHVFPPSHQQFLEARFSDKDANFEDIVCLKCH